MAVALPFAVNLVANLLFLPIIVRLRSVSLAADIVVVWQTIIGVVVAVAQGPPSVWMSLAAVLELSITAMTGRGGQ